MKERSIEKPIAYLEGIFEILCHLNEDNHGRECFIYKLFNVQYPKDSIRDLLGGRDVHIMEESIDDFRFDLEYIYKEFFTNYLFKISTLLDCKIELTEIERISDLLNDDYIKRLFINSILVIFSSAKRIKKVRLKVDHLPCKGFLIELDNEFYYLHFEIT
ncbi:hypothetical protein [Tenacibaculum sp. nBUS_03]|uniref:hypothetical protein n=1 Tax=Tenacibaculum sp. nBUS_03 TaxID=3395320 RepID=UPI003EBD3C4B